MDRLIYTAMTGAKHAFMQQAGVANNLANVSTIGFKAQMHRFLAVPVLSEAMPSRAFVVDASIQNIFDEGPLLRTDNGLDVAVDGQGWIAVQTADGGEAYTRAGALEINVNGVLQTKSGHIVAGDGGPISIPPDNNVTIGDDGTVSVIPTFGTPNVVNVVGRIKLVNPPEAELERGGDGLFRLRGGGVVPADENVRLATGYLEGSNVNPAEAMVNLISLSRQFEMQIKLLQTADQNARQADQLLSLT
ncbi:flagellar basal-body rod protein FlgF [Azovibrio restrictus]|uniref:flagellar basal-body rod protein FlgF n=1 Tax=Azovibrio restrictus TaxID=146938 RepID=UPI0026EFBA52|nr:flagellar basal-body rod protein FlgF [Azovibrio restrictus]